MLVTSSAVLNAPQNKMPATKAAHQRRECQPAMTATLAQAVPEFSTLVTLLRMNDHPCRCPWSSPGRVTSAASEASARANRVLKVLNDPHVRIDELHSAKGGTWRTNLGVSLEPTEDTALYVGGASVGDDNKLDLQLIKKRNAWDFSAGAMQGKFGIGVGYDLGKRFRIYSQLYDFNDAKVRVGGEYKLNSNLSLVGESLDIRNGDGHDVYLGMRAYF